MDIATKSNIIYASIDNIISDLKLEDRFESFKLVSIQNDDVEISVTGKNITFGSNPPSEATKYNDLKVANLYVASKKLHHTLVYNRIINDVIHFVIINPIAVIYATSIDDCVTCNVESYLPISNGNISKLIDRIDANTKNTIINKIVNFRASNVTSSAIELNWLYSGSTNISVYRNDKKIATGHTGQYIDKLLCPNTTYKYKLNDKDDTTLASLDVTTETTPQIQTIAVGDEQQINIKVGLKDYKFKCNIVESGKTIEFKNPSISHIFNDIGVKTIHISPTSSIKHITKLDISNCNIIEIADQFLLTMVDSLRTFNISNNPNLEFNLKRLNPLKELNCVNLSNTKTTGSFNKLPTTLSVLILNNTLIKSIIDFDFSRLCNIRYIELSNNNLTLEQLDTIIQAIYDNRFNFAELNLTLDIRFNDTIPLNSNTFKLLFYLTINPHEEEFTTWKILANVEELSINTSDLKLHDGIINQYMVFVLKPDLITSINYKTTFSFEYDDTVDNNNIVKLKPETLSYAVDSVDLRNSHITGDLTKLCSHFPNVTEMFNCSGNILASGDVVLLPKHADAYDFSNTNITGNVNQLSKTAKFLKFDNTKINGNVRDFWDTQSVNLSLSNCENVTGNIDLLPDSITTLDLSFTNVDGGVNNKFNNLKTVNLESTDTTFDLNTVSLNVELTDLNLNNCPNATGVLSDLNTSSQLKTLHVANTQIKGNLTDLPPNLINVDLTNCDIVLDSICHLTKLINLNLTNTINGTILEFLNNVLEFIHNFDANLVIDFGEIEFNTEELSLIANISQKIKVKF